MAVIPVMNKSCGVAIAQSLMNQDLYLAWAGLDFGETDWGDNPPVIDPSKEVFDNEICRRLITTKKYVIQDDSGNILSGGLRWSESPNPTNCIMLTTTHELTDASDSVVFKFGIVGGTKLVKGANKNFALPSQILENGYLITSANINKLVRSPTVAESREVILRF